MSICVFLFSSHRKVSCSRSPPGYHISFSSLSSYSFFLSIFFCICRHETSLVKCQMGSDRPSSFRLSAVCKNFNASVASKVFITWSFPPLPPQKKSGTIVVPFPFLINWTQPVTLLPYNGNHSHHPSPSSFFCFLSLLITCSYPILFLSPLII